MDKKELADTQALIVRDFEIEKSPDEQLSEEALFQLLADQIAYMIEYRLEFLLSLMYRMDIDERKVNKVLHPAAEDPANIGLAKLVWDRQQQRAFTKKFYKQDQLDDLDGLEL
ncbi:MAG: hypothetical protein MK226_17460 [Saprospiraceae bacterium]|jgi:hypothetical protein|nr:hypothetical protein [Saprospiraceae bacterium]